MLMDIGSLKWTAMCSKCYLFTSGYKSANNSYMYFYLSFPLNFQYDINLVTRKTQYFKIIINLAIFVQAQDNTLLPLSQGLDCADPSSRRGLQLGSSGRWQRFLSSAGRTWAIIHTRTRCIPHTPRNATWSSLSYLNTCTWSDSLTLGLRARTWFIHLVIYIFCTSVLQARRGHRILLQMVVNTM